jgi:tRNA(Ile)-lysidine synthase
MRSHPPSLTTIVRRTVREEGLIARGDHVLVGVSGGPDSLALAHVLGRLRASLGFELSAVGVDHGLRPEASAELELAEGVMDSSQVPFQRVRLNIGGGANLMARAREARLAALREHAKAIGADAIALGHHADDRAETVIIRLLQGAGPAGLAVLAPRADDLIRPLIRARRADVLLHLERHRVPFASDPTNVDRRYLRAAVRLDVMPALAGLSSRVVEHLCDLADDLGAMGVVSPSPVLKRSQLKALAQGAAGRGTVRVALPGGRTARFDPKGGAIVVEPAPQGQKRPRSTSQTPK